MKALNEELLQKIELTGSNQALKREKANANLRKFLTENSKENNTNFEETILSEIKRMTASDKWEYRYGALQTASISIDLGYFSKEEHFQYFVNIAKKAIEDPEFRARMSVKELLISAIKKKGLNIYEQVRDILFENIEINFIRGADKAEKDFGQEINQEVYYDNPVFQNPKEFDPKKALHDAAGWQQLETSMKILQGIADVSKLDFVKYIDEKIISIAERATQHLNRFVREISHYLIGTFYIISNKENLIKLGEKFCLLTGRGLSDNWSQVRYAASQAGRTFLLAGNSDPVFCDKFYPILLPMICLSRYYLAEGVRLYSQESWKLIVKEEGKKILIKYLPEFIKFYISQSRGENHAVREAACHSIAEICDKIVPTNKAEVSPFVNDLLKCLIDCFMDMSWPVRDAACGACGSFVAAFPEESKPELDKLFQMWCSHLSDNIESVRQNSAVALCKAAKALGNEFYDKLDKVLTDTLPLAKTQQPNSEKFSNLKKEASKFGVVPNVTVKTSSSIEEHSDQVMFSCGSLAPKLKKGGAGSDYGIAGPRQPWESSDGAVYLLLEISKINPKIAEKHMQVLYDITRLDHFTHSANLKETIFNSFVDILKNIGKQKAKDLAELFLPELLRSAKSIVRNSSETAMECLYQLGKWLGPSIVKGRAENTGSGNGEEFMKIYNEIEQKAKISGNYPVHLQGNPHNNPHTQPNVKENNN